MCLSISRSKNNEFLYIIKDIYFDKKRTSKVSKKLSKTQEFTKDKNMSRDEVISWAKNYASELTQKDKEDHHDKMTPFYPNKIIERDVEKN